APFESCEPGAEALPINDIDLRPVDNAPGGAAGGAARRQPLGIAPDQPHRDPRPGIGGGQRGAEPARRAGNDNHAIRRSHRVPYAAPEITAAAARRPSRPAAQKPASPTNGAPACPVTGAP